jgi:hypothetical protein
MAKAVENFSFYSLFDDKKMNPGQQFKHKYCKSTVFREKQMKEYINNMTPHLTIFHWFVKLVFVQVYGLFGHNH